MTYITQFVIPAGIQAQLSDATGCILCRSQHELHRDGDQCDRALFSLLTSFLSLNINAIRALNPCIDSSVRAGKRTRAKSQNACQVTKQAGQALAHFDMYFICSSSRIYSSSSLTMATRGSAEGNRKSRDWDSNLSLLDPGQVTSRFSHF